MLKSLSIENYALISALHIDFYEGLNTITGETGAGKSILLGALSLILGQRADTSALNDKDKKCIIEAVFSLKDFSIRNFFDQNDLDYETETIIRREINNKGKTRAFINDTPVSVSLLKELGRQLVDIHSQHENLVVGNDKFQLSVIDAYAENAKLLEEYYYQYLDYKKKKKEFEDLQDRNLKAKDDLDYLEFLFQELEQAHFIENEQEELEEEMKTLSHTEEIKMALSEAIHLLSESEFPITDSLKNIVSTLSSIENYHAEAKGISERLNSVFIELSDINNEIYRLNDKVDHDPERAEFIRERLDLVYHLQQKHHVGTIKELLNIQEDLDRQIAQITDYDQIVEKLRLQLEESKEKLNQMAGNLTRKRKEVCEKFEEEVVLMLGDLGIKNAGFKVKIEESDEFSSQGKDHVNFLFSANKNYEPKTLHKIISGGEISRLMLTLKSILSQTASLPTIIFDEIDTGTSGEIADKMGTIIKKMSKNLQVINITHLPQIASKGDYHYLVYKDDSQSKTYTGIKLLNKEERIQEVAKMLSGEGISSAAIQNAKDLLGMT